MSQDGQTHFENYAAYISSDICSSKSSLLRPKANFIIKKVNGEVVTKK